MTADEFHTELHRGLGRPIREVRQAPQGRFVPQWVIHEPGSHRASWASAKVDFKRKVVDVALRVELRQNKLRSPDFARLKELVRKGVAQYWSRAVRIGQEGFWVNVVVVESGSRALKVDLIAEFGENYRRSYAMGIFGLPTVVVYNAGAYKKNRRNAESNFKLTAAHEIGHSILKEFGGRHYSATHKGTSTLLQSTARSSAGYSASGEIDLMKYYDEEKGEVPEDVIQSISVASERDVRCLILISSLSFV